jgi:hypothetical protein
VIKFDDFIPVLWRLFMKRIFYAVLVLAISMLACSLGRGGQTAVESPENSQQPEVSQAEEISPEQESSSEEPAGQPALPDVEMGDCGAGIGPGVNLAKCDLTDRNLSDSNLSGANLAQADLSVSNLSEVDFSNANMSGAKAIESNMSDANFSDADLTGADLSGSNLIEANFTDAITVGVDFSGCNMTGAIISQAQLDQSLSVKGAVLPDGTIGK